MSVDTSTVDSLAVDGSTVDAGLDVPCAGQLIDIEPGAYDWIVLSFASSEADGAGEAGGDPAGEVEETVWLHYRGGTDREWLRCRSGASSCRIPVPRHDILVALRLPDRPYTRIRGIALIPAPPIPSVTPIPSVSITPAPETITHG